MKHQLKKAFQRLETEGELKVPNEDKARLVDQIGKATLSNSRLYDIQEALIDPLLANIPLSANKVEQLQLLYAGGKMKASAGLGSSFQGSSIAQESNPGDVTDSEWDSSSGS